MKFLKYLLYIIIGLIIFTLVIGLLKPSVNYGQSVVVNKPIQEAWDVQQDPNKLNQWIEGFKSIELLSGEEGSAGSKYKVIVNPGEGQEDFEMIETIVSIKEKDHIKLSFDSDNMLFEQKTTFTEKDGQTNIRTESKVIGNGLLMKSMFAMMEAMGGMFQKQEEKNIEALKKAIESNVTQYE